MKGKVLHVITTILMTIGCDYAITAQEVDMMLYNRDVNGIEIGTLMTKEQVIECFGEPTEYKIYDNGLDGKGESFFYGKTRLHFDNGVFDGFYLCTQQFVAFTNHVKGGIKVGTPLSYLNDFEFGRPLYVREGVYELFYEADNPVTLIVSDGIIIGIVYSEPV